jgi:hypothetical protein
MKYSSYDRPQATFPEVTPHSFRPLPNPAPEVARPYDDLAFIPFHFEFKTKVGLCTAVANIVCTSSGYKAWTLNTILEGLIDFPEIGRADGHIKDSRAWSAVRDADAAFEDTEPEVIIVGGGHK